MFSFGLILKNEFYCLYVDDIVITGDDAQEINELKLYLYKKFQTKNLG